MTDTIKPAVLLGGSLDITSSYYKVVKYGDNIVL